MLNNLMLRPTVMEDLEILFEFQTNEEGIYLAAFTSVNPNDKEAYMQKYSKLLIDPAINNQTIFINDEIVGSIAKYEMEGDAEITYWIDRKHWGKGIATAALQMFLKIENARPIFGRTAFDNVGSRKVMENCGFVRIGADKGFANARQQEIEEFIFKLS